MLTLPVSVGEFVISHTGEKYEIFHPMMEAARVRRMINGVLLYAGGHAAKNNLSNRSLRGLENAAITELILEEFKDLNWILDKCGGLQQVEGVDDEKQRAFYANVLLTALHLSGNGYEFGGYLRDQVAGDRFNDIDIFTKYPKVVMKLIFKYFSIEQLMPEAYYTSWNIFNLTVDKYIVGDLLEVDIVSSKTSEHPFDELDADVNSLYWDYNTAGVQAFRYDLNEVLDHIKNKTFMPGPNEMQRCADVRYKKLRFQKLLRRGYSNLAH